MIWSPASASFMHGATEEKSQQPWDDATTLIDIEQLQQSMPTTQPDSMLAGSGFDEANRNGVDDPASQTQGMRQEMTSADISQGYGNEGVRENEEEGMVSLDKLGLDELSEPLMDGQPSIPSSMMPVNEV